MPISRMDLADAGSPDKLVSLILAAEPDMPPAVPIEQLCRQLDIMEIQPLETDAFEGGLITDPERSHGIVLVNKASHAYRQRFTMAHELGHFLIPTHIPDTPGRFLCSRADMMKLSTKETDRRERMEVEANRFASLLLIAPPKLRPLLRRRAPDLQHLVQLARRFEVSKQAMMSAYVNCHEEILAAVVVHNGKVLYTYRDRVRFPFIPLSRGAQVPADTLYHRIKREPGVASDFAETLADNWIDVRRGEYAPALYEQVYPQQDGHALILLHLVKQDEDEEDEEVQLQRSWEPKLR